MTDYEQMVKMLETANVEFAVCDEGPDREKFIETKDCENNGCHVIMEFDKNGKFLGLDGEIGNVDVAMHACVKRQTIMNPTPPDRMN